VRMLEVLCILRQATRALALQWFQTARNGLRRRLYSRMDDQFPAGCGLHSRFLATPLRRMETPLE
jgi:hypothetical protein